MGELGEQCGVARLSTRLETKYFINEEDAWHELGNALVDIFVHDLVYLLSQLFGDFSFLWLHDLSHQ